MEVQSLWWDTTETRPPVGEVKRVAIVAPYSQLKIVVLFDASGDESAVKYNLTAAFILQDGVWVKPAFRTRIYELLRHLGWTSPSWALLDYKYLPGTSAETMAYVSDFIGGLRTVLDDPEFQRNLDSKLREYARVRELFTGIPSPFV